MAISTYAELKTAVASWLDRDDLTSTIPDFVALAEAEIRTDVRCQAMEQFTSDTLAGNTLAHPARYLSARRLTVGGDLYQYVSPEVYQAASENGSTERYFTSIGQTFYMLNAAVGNAYTLIYYRAFPAFSASTDTNWLLENYPMIYLAAASRQGAVFLDDDAKAAKYGELYQDAVGRLTARERASAVSGGPLVMRSAISE